MDNITIFASNNVFRLMSIFQIIGNTWNASLRRLENTSVLWMLSWRGLWKRERD